MNAKLPSIALFSDDEVHLEWYIAWHEYMEDCNPTELTPITETQPEPAL